MTKKKDSIIVTAGDYDLVNSEDLKFLEKCKAKGDWLIVGLHSDMQVYLRCNTIYNNYEERQTFLSGLRPVDEVLKFALEKMPEALPEDLPVKETIQESPVTEISVVTKH